MNIPAMPKVKCFKNLLKVVMLQQFPRKLMKSHNKNKPQFYRNKNKFTIFTSNYDLENSIKQIHVKSNEVNNLTVGERIIVKCDDYNTAYGEAQGLLVGYCGSLAIDCNLFPISFARWLGPLGMPKKYMEDCFETILKPRFLFEVRESIAYRYCNASISKKWALHIDKGCGMNILTQPKEK
ncbi:hypothetical protein KY284_001334 [Solanum tuberosum]|nr:hypothetical protein KY284_001334 [Solanum tuberosum]